VARKRAKRDDEDREVSRIEKASYWLAHAIMFAVKAAAASPDDRGDPAFKRAIERWQHDTQDTLAISLEAYALALSERNADRADTLIADLELGPKGLRRPRGGHYYHDLLEIREIGRRFQREQEKRKRQIAALEKIGDRSKDQEAELKQLRAIVKRWEEDGY
jgi:hypothetical protein